MRRSLPTLVACAVLGLPSLLRAQDSTTTAPRGGTPEFHAGQWGALFASSEGFYGVGALRFSTPTKAWTLSGNFRVAHNSQDPGDYSSDLFSTGVSIGRRWFRAGSGRVRPYSELGISGSYSWGTGGASGYSTKWQGYGGGFYGQVGAQVFFAPELSLGAAWNASLLYNHDHSENASGGSGYSNDRSSFSADAGRIQLIGTLYF